MNGDRLVFRRYDRKHRPLNGPLTTYSSDGRMEHKIYYLDGIRHGAEIFYDRSQFPVRVRSWVNGRLRGPEKRADPRTLVFRTVCYWLDDELLPEYPPERPVMSSC